MIPTVIVDTNVIVRFLLANDPKLSPQAKAIIASAQTGKFKIYLDEVIIAETIWVLSSYYKLDKAGIIEKLTQFINPKWVVSPRKKLLLSVLHLYATTNLHFIDAWLAQISRSLHFPLKTFDRALQKLAS